VRHPNVVTIYGAEQIADRVGLWMELVAGKTLEQLLEGGRTFTPSEARLGHLVDALPVTRMCRHRA